MSRKISVLLFCAVVLFSFTACAAGEDHEANIKDEEAYQQEILRNVGRGKKVYFAGPMFNQSEKDFNLEITKVLEACGYQVFLPQRDGIEAAKLEGRTEEEMTKMIFALDAGKVREADIIFMNIDGRVPDEGACVELGIAYACGKRCYGFKTDTRAVEFGLTLNPMISGCMIKIFENHDGRKMIEEMKAYLSQTAL